MPAVNTREAVSTVQACSQVRLSEYASAAAAFGHGQSTLDPQASGGELSPASQNTRHPRWEQRQRGQLEWVSIVWTIAALLPLLLPVAACLWAAGRGRHAPTPVPNRGVDAPHAQNQQGRWPSLVVELVQQQLYTHCAVAS